MLLFAHPTGNANAHNLALGLAADGLLAEYWTCLDYPADDRGLRFLPGGLTREARRRRLPDALKPYARLQPGRELGRLLGHKLGLGRWIGREASPWSIDGVYRGLDRRVARRLAAAPGLRGVYLYEDGAAESFAAARRRGLATFYDLPIGYWRAAHRILAEEAERSPEWAGTLKANFDSPAKLARKDRELELADTVFVASSFTRETLREAPGGAGRDVVLLPYGAPAVPAAPAPVARRAGEPLRILFVGSLGQRKGLRYLLEAVETLGPGHELTLIGRPPAAGCAPLERALRRHRHIPALPHAGILDEMRRHHVFVFPSLFEGFGLVLLEAMACGLPVIATPHTAAPDIVEPGVEGFIVPIRSPEAIAARLGELAADEPRRQAMGRAARLRAEAFTWAAYRAGAAAAVRQRLSLSA